MQKSVKLLIHGKVQGVFYRQNTKEQADRLGLKGFVQNLPDGSVSVEASGDAGAVDQLVNWCRQGPARAEVSKVIVEETLPVVFSSFSIKR